MSEKNNEQVKIKDEEVKETTMFNKIKKTAGHIWTKAKPVVKAGGIGILAGAAILGIVGVVANKMEADDMIDVDVDVDETEDVPVETDSKKDEAE